MKLVYINGTFLRYTKKYMAKDLENNIASKNPSLGELRALFFDEEKKTWQNPYEMNERRRLDLVKNENEFNERKWLLAKRSDIDGYRHEGPYSSHEIFDMLFDMLTRSQGSQVQFSDPIWKTGQSKWLAIRQTPTFRELAILSKPIETDIADILSHVVEYNPEMRRVEKENIPPNIPEERPDEIFLISDD